MASIINDLNEARTLVDFLASSVAKWPDRPAFRGWRHKEKAWESLTWKQFGERVHAWRCAFARMGLAHGARVSMLLPNSIEAAVFDMAALSNGLTPVPLHAIDTPGNCAYILADSGCEFLVTATQARWNAIEAAGEPLPALRQVVILGSEPIEQRGGHCVCSLAEWLARGKDCTDFPQPPEAEDLAAIVYTSGTTGKPKGVMLTHHNIVANVQGLAALFRPDQTDRFLSFLPFSHTFERTVTYYTAMACGSELVFTRGIMQLMEDLQQVQPTCLCSVPRIYERIYARVISQYLKADEGEQQIFAWAQETGWRNFCRSNGLPVEHSWREELDPVVWDWLDSKVASKIRALFGGKIKTAIAGGAALNGSVSRFFCAMGLPLRQGYGLTESSPVISVNVLTGGNHPLTVGPALPNIEARIGENDELQVRGPSIMKGYWNRPEDTRSAFTEDGWLRTGDQADMADGGRITIKGRIKEIIVTSSGEKIAPNDLEHAIEDDPIVDQVMVIGENRPFIAALVVVNPEHWHDLCTRLELDPMDPASLTARSARQDILRRIAARTKDFPKYGVPREVILTQRIWSAENSLLTPTMKLRRRQINEAFATEIEACYRDARRG